MAQKILIVDDSATMRLRIRDILQTAGFQTIEEAANGKQAVEKFKNFKPDLTTMDIVMPEMDGVEALENIMKLDQNAKVIMVTAIDQKDSLMKTVKLGASDYIVKPFEEERVLGAVKAVFEPHA